MEFTYTPTLGPPSDWEITSDPVSIASDEMQDEDTGQSHPDIVYDQLSGDIYCAWNNNVGLAANGAFLRGNQVIFIPMTNAFLRKIGDCCFYAHINDDSQ